MLRYLATGADRPLLQKPDDIRRLYDFANVFMFWIGASIASILLAMIAWNAKASE